MEPSPYLVRRTSTKPPLSGRLDDECWQRAEMSPRFVDMKDGRPGWFDTRAAALWDDEALYIGFWVEEPYPTAHLTERDSIIFNEHDVEVFVDGGDCYYELEINARNTVYEVFFIWRDAYAKGGRFDVPEFDVHNPNAFTFAGDFDRQGPTFWRGTHPRGARWAFLDYDLPGLETATHIDGVLNDSSQVSRGWTCEIKLPWAGMTHLAGDRSLPPQDGDDWRLFFGRFQKVPVVSGVQQAAWCWTPHGEYDTHMPDRFTPVRFSNEAV
ncbi:hypothetical protein EON82_03390 [bacterium]|nr:MAG: hypothetical protein EON82_03390 [bacterium]